MMTPGSPARRARRKTSRSWRADPWSEMAPPRSEAIAGDAPVERAPRQSERLGGAAHVPFVARECFLNEHFLNVLERQVLEPRRGRRPAAQAKVADAHLFALGQQHGALHGVVQLADVPRPRVGKQRLDRAVVEAGERFAIALGVP